MALTLPRLNVGDVRRTKINSIVSTVESVINAFPGSLIAAASVGIAALAKPKAHFEMEFLSSIPIPTATAGMGGASVTDVGKNWTVPQIDGAAATFTLTNWCFSVGADGNPATALAKVAGSELRILLDNVVKVTVDLNAAALAVGTPLEDDGLSFTCTSGQVWSLNYVAGGAGARYPAPSLSAGFSLNHCGT